MTTKSQRKKAALAKFEDKEFMKKYKLRTKRQMISDIKTEWKNSALRLPIETRREFLKMWWDKKSPREIRNTLGLSSDEVLGILNLNSKKTIIETINRPENCI